jgi:hypothetical protein
LNLRAEAKADAVWLLRELAALLRLTTLPDYNDLEKQNGRDGVAPARKSICSTLP